LCGAHKFHKACLWDPNIRDSLRIVTYVQSDYSAQEFLNQGSLVTNFGLGGTVPVLQIRKTTANVRPMELLHNTSSVLSWIPSRYKQKISHTHSCFQIGASLCGGL